MSQFIISNGENLSIQNLLDLKREGYHVARSGHVGNQYLSNLLLHSLGIPAQQFDRNKLLTDVNYHPSCIIQDGQRSDIAVQKDVLVPFSESISSGGEAFSAFSSGKNPGQIHYESLCRIFGSEMVFSESELMAYDINLLEKLADIISSSYPDFFFRRVDSGGATRIDKFLPKKVGEEVIKLNEALLDKLCGKAIYHFDGGIFPEIEVALIIGTIMSALASGQNRVFELSGPAMIKYSLNESFKKCLSEIYAIVRNNVSNLPETLELVVVPTFYFRFGSLASEKDEMDQLWESLKQLSLVHADKKKKLEGFSGAGLSRLSENEARKKIAKQSNEAMDRLAREIFSAKKITARMDFSEGNFSKQISLKNEFFSQYDLLAAGERLYVPDEIQNLSMKEVEKFYNILDMAKQRIS